MYSFRRILEEAKKCPCVFLICENVWNWVKKLGENFFCFQEKLLAIIHVLIFIFFYFLFFQSEQIFLAEKKKFFSMCETKWHFLEECFFRIFPFFHVKKRFQNFIFFFFLEKKVPFFLSVKTCETCKKSFFQEDLFFMSESVKMFTHVWNSERI